jgi:5-formyltetrahydrofolate cyclo-ligase
MTDGAEVVPTVILAPVIGLGYPSASIPTIHPQPHDIPMSAIVTGENLSAR